MQTLAQMLSLNPSIYNVVSAGNSHVTHINMNGLALTLVERHEGDSIHFTFFAPYSSMVAPQQILDSIYRLRRGLNNIDMAVQTEIDYLDQSLRGTINP